MTLSPLRTYGSLLSLLSFTVAPKDLSGDKEGEKRARTGPAEEKASLGRTKDEFQVFLRVFGVLVSENRFLYLFRLSLQKLTVMKPM